ncbi:MAG: hypothetical protein GX624_09260 [Actinobacteria bacterium]|nr:hypothetical protein [Actinomycetota bacterium]
MSSRADAQQGGAVEAHPRTIVVEPVCRELPAAGDQPDAEEGNRKSGHEGDRHGDRATDSATTAVEGHVDEPIRFTDHSPFVHLTHRGPTSSTIRTTPTASGKRIQLDTTHTLSFYSGDASEIAPGQISAFTYGGGGGYLYLTGPKVTGQVTTSYISLHGTATRKDILLAALGGASVTIGAAATPNQVTISGDLYVSGNATVNGQLTVNGATVFYGTNYFDNAQVTRDCNVGGRIYPTTNCASGISADGVWINDLNTPSRRWKLYMTNAPGTYQLYARYGSAGTEYRNIGP